MSAGQHIIFERVRNTWIRSTWLAWTIVGAAIAAFVFFLLHQFYAVSLLWAIPVMILLTILMIYFDKSWRINSVDVARYLDKQFPELQESSSLLLEDSNRLNFLQQVQAKKAATTLEQLKDLGKTTPKLKSALLLLGIAILGIAAGFVFSEYSGRIPENKNAGTVASEHEAYLKAALSSISISVQPPAYTRLPVEIQRGGAVRALEGSVLQWKINLNKPITSLELLINDIKTVPLQVSKDSISWSVSMKMPGQGYYQVKSKEISSPLFQLESIRDQSPQVRVQSPAPDLLIRYGEPERIRLSATLKDDYGIQSGKISGTVSRGSGEAVKFEQKNISINNNFSAHLKEYNINQVIDLKSLGMIPGDELYLFITAQDIHQQESKSDIFRIILEDTAQLFSMDGLNSGLDIKPEFFRSQRQIIIETEQLLRDQAQSKITKEQFQEKSNNLGIDQKLLRLRYGKFLGEESSTYESSEDHGDHAAPGNQPANILSEYGHTHDNAEDATYFDPETKKQLRATLNEMWKSELQLRTYQPKDALPYEYEALRLLKDLQQKSRAYVAKTNMKTTPLKAESRLTGELKDILQPVYSTTYEYKPDPDDPVRESLGAMTDLQAGKAFSFSDLEQLKKAHLVLSRKAMETPTEYLTALKAIRNLLPALEQQQQVHFSDIVIVSKAFQQMLGVPPTLPIVRSQQATDLSDAYFRNLKKILH